jgi:hypothetical protein
MGLLAPLALLFVPLLAVIAAFYLLRLRRPETVVSSLSLWESLLRDREANAPWQKLRTNLLLLLQLLIVGALILALARPWSASGGAGGRVLVLILDVSASMAARDGERGGTRLDDARRLALARVDQLPENGQATVIATAGQARVVLAASNDRNAIRRAITGLQPTAGPTDLREALTLAAALAAADAGAEIRIYSDGRFPDPRADLPTVAGRVVFTPVGQRGENQGIVALALRRDVGTVSLFAQVINQSDAEVSRRLDIELDGEAWAGRTLTLPPGETQQVLLDDVPLAAQVVHARLAGSDDLQADDDAWTVNRLADPAPVLMVTTSNRFLQNALVLLPNVTLEKSRPETYAPSPTATLTVFDRFVPTGTLPTGNLLFLAPPRSTDLFQVTGVLTAPAPLLGGVAAAGGSAVPAASDPLLRFVDLSDLHIAAAQQVLLPDWGHTVLDSDAGGPLIIAGETGGRKVVIVTFDLHDSDLPIQVAFPLLMRNLVGYLLPEPAGGLPASVSAGSAVPLVPDATAAITRITVEPPPGAGPLATFAVDAAHPTASYADTAALGLYIVSQWAGDQEVHREGFAVNLFNPDESRTAPRANPPLPVGRPTPEGTVAEPGRVEWWPWLAAAALAVLLVEWLVSHQLALRRLGARLRAWRERRAAAEAR